VVQADVSQLDALVEGEQLPLEEINAVEMATGQEEGCFLSAQS
jgi:hypothetical protein